MKGPDGNILEFKDQWHIYSRPNQKAGKFRYLSIFQIKPINDHSEFLELKLENGTIKLSGWEISAELDVAKEASFKIVNQNENKALIYNLPEISLVSKKYHPKIKGSTLLVEIFENNEIKKEAVDEFPKGRD